jgi:hypothetical protein
MHIAYTPVAADTIFISTLVVQQIQIHVYSSAPPVLMLCRLTLAVLSVYLLV